MLSFYSSKILFYSFVDTSWVIYRLTEKVFAKGGLNLTERFNFDRTKQIAFSDYQITKKSNMKSKLRLKATGSSIINSPRLLQIHYYNNPTFLFLLLQNAYK